MMSPSANLPFINPGELFLELHGPPRQLDDVLFYARWLRSESGISADALLDLSVVYSHFRMPTPSLVPLPGQHGMLLYSDIGYVLVNENDHAMRQRFTEAHELIEFYFEAMAEETRRTARPSDEWTRRKEDWCDEGAAELLIPRVAITPVILKSGVSFETARNLAAEYRVSLTASLWQMIKASEGRHAIVQWRVKHKPSELATIASADKQMTMFGQPEDTLPKKRLRVEWAVGNAEMVFFPADKSIEDDTAVHAAWRDGIFTHGDDKLVLGKRVIQFASENQPFELHGERQVLSLITLNA